MTSNHQGQVPASSGAFQDRPPTSADMSPASNNVNRQEHHDENHAATPAVDRSAAAEEVPADDHPDNASTASRKPDDDDDPQPPLPFSKARCIALVATVTGAAFLNTLSIQSVVIILPTIGDTLSIPESRLQWIVSSYSLAFGCFLLVWGRIADIYGKRLIFVAGSIWVTIVTVINPFLPNEIAFDLFRALHGLGAAANVPTAIGILGVTFPPGRAKNYAFSTYAAGAPLGSVLGNITSGFIAEYANWKWVFGAGAIMAGIISAAGYFIIPPPPPAVVAATGSDGADAGRNAEGGAKDGRESSQTAASVDWIGAVLVTVGLLLLLFALTEGNVVGWSTPWIPALIVVSILILVAFCFWQHYLETRGRHTPLVKISMFRSTRFSAVMLVMALCFASFNDFIIFATYYFQDYQDLSPLHTMLRFIPTGVGGAIIAAIVAQLIHRVPTVFILGCGNVAVSLANLLFAVPIPPNTNYFAWAFLAMIFAVIGADTAWPALTLFTSRALPPGDQAMGGALINAAGQLGRAIGLAVSTAAQTAVTARARGVPVEHAGGMLPWDAPSLWGIRAAAWVNFGLGLASLCLVPVAFRSLEIIGRANPVPRPRTEGGEEGVMHQADADAGERPQRHGDAEK